MYTIYGLIDPRTYAIRYVGMTSNHPSVRLASHMETHKDRAECKNRWIDDLKSFGLKPSMVLLDFAPDIETAERKERWWITHGIVTGWELTNEAHAARGRRRKEARMRPSTNTPAEPPGPTDYQARAALLIRNNPDTRQIDLRRCLGISKAYANELWHTLHPNGDNPASAQQMETIRQAIASGKISVG